MKTSIIEIPRLFDIKTDRTQKIICWDIDNAYPYRYMWLSDKSVTASSCIDTFANFLTGKGWIDRVFGESVVGPKNYTGDDLGEDVFDQWSQHRGYAIIVGLNGLLEHSSYQVMPFERVRKGDAEKVGQFAVHDHWGKTGIRFYPKDIQWFPPYTEDPNRIMKYIEDAGSFEKFKGMLLYVSVDKRNYPTPKYAAALEDVETEALISVYQRKNAQSGFMAAYIIKFTEEFDTEKDRQDMKDQLAEFSGAGNNSKAFVLDGVDTSDDGEDVTIEAIPSNDVDRLFEHTEESSQDKIRRTFLVPRSLIGEEETTGFDTGRLDDSINYYNNVVIKDRNQAVRPLKGMVKNFEEPIKLNDNWDVEILKPLNSDVNNSE